MNHERSPRRLPETITINLDGNELEVPAMTAADLWIQTSKRVLGARLMDLANSNTEGVLSADFRQDYTDLLTYLEGSLNIGDETWVSTLARLEKDAVEAAPNDDRKLGLHHVQQMDMLVSQVKSAQDFLDEAQARGLKS